MENDLQLVQGSFVRGKSAFAGPAGTSGYGAEAVSVCNLFMFYAAKTNVMNFTPWTVGHRGNLV